MRMKRERCHEAAEAQQVELKKPTKHLSFIVFSVASATSSSLSRSPSSLLTFRWWAVEVAQCQVRDEAQKAEVTGGREAKKKMERDHGERPQ